MVIKRFASPVLVLLFILLTGFFLRSYNLSDIPSGFFCDEASTGYNAYSLLTKGTDDQNVTFPLFFYALGDYRPPIAIYSAVPFIATMGLNEVATRLPSVVYGTVLILILFMLGKEIKNTYLGILVSAVAATMPWLIHYNRIGFGFTEYATYFCLTVLLLLKSIRRKSLIIPSFISAALSLYTYQPARLIIPLMLIGFVAIHWKTYLYHKKFSIAGILSFAVLSIPLLLVLLTGQGFARFNAVSVFSAKLSPFETILRVMQNYLQQISPAYFISGEQTFITRHFTAGLTPLLLSTLPFGFVGLIKIFLTLKNKTSQFLLLWFAIYPVAGAVTAEAPFTSRSIIGAPLFAVLISIGILAVGEYIKHRQYRIIVLTAILLVISLNVISFTKFYFIKYPLSSSDFWGWQYGAKEIVTYFKDHETEYDDLIMAPEFNAPEIFFKFYSPNNCSNCTIGLPDSHYIASRKQLFAVTPNYINNHPGYTYHLLKNITYPNGNPAFFLAEVTKE